jgi:poly(beta-D-mannuronate) lyase
MSRTRPPLHRLLIAASAIAALPCAANAALVNPFGAPHAVVARGPAGPACPTVPVVRDMQGVGFYTDKAATQIDAAKRDQSKAAARPIYLLENQVASQTARYLQSGRTDGAAASCAMSILDSWAKGGGFTGTSNEQGRGDRRWAINATAVNFLAVETSPAIDPAARQRVANWLDQQGQAIIATIGKNTNNHLYWAAAAVAATSIAANDQRSFDWAIRMTRQGLSEIGPDGKLPQEMQRQQLAQNYHVFALEPLVQVAGFAKANGVDLYSENDGALGRLVKLVVRGFKDPSAFGGPQEFPGATPDTLSWAEQYFADTGDCAVGQLLSQHRPANKAYLGGNVSLLYGEPLGQCR